MYRCYLCYTGNTANVVAGVWAERLSPAQESAIDELLKRLNDALHTGKVKVCETSLIKILCKFFISADNCPNGKNNNRL